MSVTSYSTKKGRRWRVRLYDPEKQDMVAVSSGHRTKREATESEAAAIAAGRAESRADLTVAVGRERWLEHHKMKASTRAHNGDRTKAFAAKYGDRRMADIDRGIAIEWRRENPSTTMALSAMWTWARESEELDVGQPWAGMASNKRRVIVPGWLTPSDVEGLVAAAFVAWPKAYGAVAAGMVTTVAYMGVRPGELGGLRWTDLDAARGRATLSQQTESKTRKITSLKNDQARVVVYPPVVQRAIAAMPVMHDEHVFVGPARGLLWANVRDRVWGRVRAAAGRSELEMHELRHFCATYLTERGLTSSDIAHQLGHLDGGRLVESTYGHARPEPALDRIAEVLATAGTTTAEPEGATA